jgi:molybdopterin molybdotransferase
VSSPDTFGATEGLPAYLYVLHETYVSEEPSFTLARGAAAKVATGGMLPPGADSVVMFEHAQASEGGVLEVQRAVAPGENVIQRGEDVRAGALVCEKGTRLRPEAVAVLAGLGITEAPVYRRPRVAVISTGDEVVPPGVRLRPGLVRDMNSYILSGHVIEAGGEPVRAGIIKDDYDTLLGMVRLLSGEADAVLITGGSSVGARDLTGRVVSALGAVLFHSVLLKPGKPTLAGLVGGVPVLGLPGHPRAVSVCFDVFVRPVLLCLAGAKEEAFGRPGTTVEARLTRGVHSAAGRRDEIPVALEQRDGALWAAPLMGKSGLLSTMARADGALTVPPGVLGYGMGEAVRVRLR